MLHQNQSSTFLNCFADTDNWEILNISPDNHPGLNSEQMEISSSSCLKIVYKRRAEGLVLEYLINSVQKQRILTLQYDDNNLV